MRIEFAPRITADPQVAFGRAIVDGTGVPVELVVGKLASGMSVEEVADEYGLMPDDLLAALGDSGSVVASEQIQAAW